ncbi:MAG TPA: sigma factor [Phycisphaerae bacterium]|nr:sigma factor [Phycisphaerae bacterium]
MGQRPAEEPSDNELLVAIRREDPVALRRLMDRYDRLVRYTIYRASRRRCQRDPLWLDGVASEVWSDLCRSAHAGAHREVTNAPSYFIQIARRRCIDALRRRSSTPLSRDPSGDLDHLEPVAQQEDTLEVLANMEELTALRVCMGELEQADGRLCGEIEAITAGRWTEAAQRLGMPESTLRSRWPRVLAALRQCLEKKGRPSRA